MSDFALPQSFPTNDYTPHGYIDNPYHSMVANRSGVIRSVPPLGFGFWRRNFKGAYGTGCQAHVNYLSLLELAVAIGSTRLVTSDDFSAAGVELVSNYHTKHALSYDFIAAGARFSLLYFLPRENTLACRVLVHDVGGGAQPVVLHASHVYGLWSSKWWGSNGLASRQVSVPDGADAAVSTIWAYGDYFALGANQPSSAYKATADRDRWQHWLRDSDLSAADEATTIQGPGPLHEALSYTLHVPAGGTADLLICLSRSTNEPWALEELQTGLRTAPTILEQQLDDDEDFWAQCPQLDDDWPVTWKRGWVYDYETLRMNVRRPLGIFEHPWDAMQIHSPRSVLGEAALDMLTLSYADPETAQAVLYGTFADAPMPNVPCTREDGGMNMIAADGEACGTAPSWCFPFHALRVMHATGGDDPWLSALYPYLKEYLDWWFTHRTGSEGFFHCKCDWESGQDGSKRFPLAEGGVADFVRTVDVEASVAEALALMTHFAAIADAVEDVPYWKKLAEKRTAAVRDMFSNGWFRDVDVRTNTPIELDYQDVMMLSPLTCGVASSEQVETLRPTFAHFRENPKHWLEWPSFFWAFLEACWTARLQEFNAENIADIADRVYARTDDRALRDVDAEELYSYRIPGTANEFWPLEDTFPGGEAYGWGATLPLHIIRGLVGFREPDGPPAAQVGEASRFVLAPALPGRLCAPGRKYTLRNLRYRGVSFDVTYEVIADKTLTATIDYALPHAARLTVTDLRTGETLLAQADEQMDGVVSFAATSGGEYLLSFAWSGL